MMRNPTLNSKMYQVVADVLLLGVQLPTANALPAPSDLQQRLIGALDAMVARGRRAGIDEKQLAEARYALTAFLDEQIQKSKWTGRAEWMNQPLQLLLYQQSTAGEHFFVRLRALLQQSSAPMALEVYYLCLALGFRGRYGDSQDVRSLASFTESARRQLAADTTDASQIGPHAQPRDRATLTRHSDALVYAVIATCVLVVVIGVAGFHWATDSTLGDALRAINSHNVSGP